MRLISRGLLLAVTAGTLVLPSGSGRLMTSGPNAGTSPRSYGPNQKERYLTAEQVGYIRPGFHISVNSITIPADLKPVVDLSFTDDNGQPLDRAGNVTPGALSASFLLAWWDPVNYQYTSYITRTATAAPPSPNPGVTAIQATADSGGSWTDLEVGHATYKFGHALPSGYDVTKTHTLGIYATRNLTDILGKSYYANVEQDFRPDSNSVTDVWDVLDQSQSCNTCHDPLSAHGGSRRDVKLCVLCHSPQTTDPDTGNTVDFKVMIHKIHDGANLPSVQAGTPYQIIGFQQSVNDFSTVVFPQDIRNCTKCHETSSSQNFIWYSQPNRAACGSCHDDINWTTGDNHPAGAQADDSACASCHQPQSGHEFDASIQGAHTVPTKSAQLQGLNATIVSVTNTAPGQNPTVTFQITNGDGSPVDPSTLNEAFLVMSGPTTDYGTVPFSLFEPVTTASFDGQNATYTATNAIPAGATGTWAVALSALRSVPLNPAPRLGPANVSEAALNPVVYVAVTDPQPVPRRQVVDRSLCNNCHDDLALHGRNFLNTAMCVMCHNPNGDDSSQRPAAQNPPESIDFKRFIHRIHTGEDLSQDFTIYGYHGSVNNFNDVRFPGDRRDCVKCHVPGAQELSETPLPGLLPTPTPRDWYSPMQHTAAACLGCHDTQAAAAHAFVMTAPFGEACFVCHGPDADFAVDKVHAQ